MPYFILAAVFAAMTAVPRWMGGDPYRDGKLNLFFMAGVFPIASWLSRRYDLFLAAGFSLWYLLWCFYDSEAYGFVPALGVLIFLATAEWAARVPNAFAGVMRAVLWIQLGLSAFHLAGIYPLEMDDLLKGFAGKPLGTMGNETLLAAFLASLLPMALARWTLIEVLLTCGCIAATGSTMGVVSLIAGCAAFMWRKGHRWPVYCSAALLVSLAFVALKFAPQVEFFSLSGRLVVWPEAWRQSLARPLGWGPGAWAGLYPMWGITWGTWVQVHNDILQFLHEGGWICFPITVIGIFRLMRRMSDEAFAGTVALLMNAAGNFPFHFPPTAFMFCFYLASAKKQEVRSGRKAKNSLRRWWLSSYGRLRSLDQSPGKPENARRGRIPKAEKADS